MHTAGKVLLIIGGVITALGIVLIVGGAATANLDPSNENYYAGNGGDTWTIPGDDFYAVYTSSSVNCESFEMTITSPDDPDYNLFSSSCDYNNEDDKWALMCPQSTRRLFAMRWHMMPTAP